MKINLQQRHYVPLFRRSRSNYTDYKVRRILAVSKILLLVPRVTGRNVNVQVTEMAMGGDKVLVSASARELIKLGWKGSRKSLPAAYLTGLLAGSKAVEVGVKKVTLYIGLESFVAKSRIMAVVKGVRDAGVEVPADPETLPLEARIKGEHISAYAKSLHEKNREEYSERFSGLIKAGLKPEDYPSKFEAVKNKILEKSKVKKSE
ncbi:MAG: 50S ribosomal protein L18 [Thaumarchaeota archaeon]|nr:50S ribosomal protein L18 [Nitrososphaerota archaeon]